MKAEATLRGSEYAGIGAASAITLDLLGVPLQPIVWGLIGGFVGAGFAPQMPLWRALLMYAASSLLSAEAGTAVAAHWFNSVQLYANAGAAILAILFHPLLAGVVAAVPAIITSFAARFTAKKDEIK